MASKELDTGVVDPSREIVESESELKQEVKRLKQQMEEMYQAWIKGHPPTSFPTNYTENPASIPPLSQTQVLTTVDLSPQYAPGFTPYHQYLGASSQTFHAPPAKTTAYPALTSAPIFVAPPRATLHRSPSEPAFPAPDTQYYDPEPTFKVTDPYPYTPHFEPPVETEKPSRNMEKDEQFRKVKSLEQSLKNMQGIGSQMPKFDLYDGHGDPVAHLRGFCSKMRGAGGKYELLILYFSQSLSGAALEWYTRQDASRWYTWDDLAQAFARHFPYNIDIVPDRLSLTKVEKKPSESFRAYGFRWREQAARVNPPMEEDEMVEYFLQDLEPTYFGHLISAIGHDTEKCWHLKRAIQELIATNQIVVQSLDVPNINQNPLPSHAETHMIEIVRKDIEFRNPSKSVMMICASEGNSVKALDSTKVTPLPVEGVTKKPSMLDVKPPVLVVKGPSKDMGTCQEKTKVVMPGISNKPVVVVEGALITLVIIKPVTQLSVVDTKAVLWNYKRVIVTYKGKEVEEEVNETGGLTRSGRCFTPEELRKANPYKDSQIPVKKSFTEEEAEEFLKKMKVQDYSIVEQLRKTPAQISLLSLLIHSDDHRRALMKISNEAHVPDKITANHLEKIAFSDDELPMEGTEHNRALYLTVKCEDSIVSRVLVDNGSSANIFPLSTLQKFKMGTEQIHMNSVCVRGFDGEGKDSIGDIMLELSIGPVEFTMEFQVLDVSVSYNQFLGRPWIHAAKAVPSSLHQMVNFEWDRQEIVVHGNEDISAYNDLSVPFIEAEDDRGPWVY
ncbi:uncharacterized protein [Nicotiana tomentosiformis]|uniref:uncharacterized protein n=1 Tax=Nicotiana tomentosiformis TaxID=4098 RepID=UPI00388C977D